MGYVCANFSLPIGLTVLDLGPIYAIDRQTSDVRRASSLNAPYPRGGGIIIIIAFYAKLRPKYSDLPRFQLYQRSSQLINPKYVQSSFEQRNIWNEALIKTSCARGDTICPRPTRCTHAAAHLQYLTLCLPAAPSAPCVMNIRDPTGSASLWAVAEKLLASIKII